MTLRRLISGALTLLVLANGAVALDRSPFPELRPSPESGFPSRAVIYAWGPGVAKSPRPKLRPGSGNAALPKQVVIASAGIGLTRSPRPELRPENLARKAAVRAAGVRFPPRPDVTGGGLCGVADIRGEQIAAIPAKVSGCGLSGGVKVTEVAGVRLSTPATMDCTTAKALRTWVAEAVVPTVGRLGGGVSQLKVAASYSCRPRNNVSGAKISEHGRGRAIDISAITLANGVSVTVLKGWNDPAQGKILKQLHRLACGPFGTVLGPNSDKYHKDHLHLDTARYSGGPYCR